MTLCRKNNKFFTNTQQFYIIDLTKLPREFNSLELVEAKIAWGRLFKIETEEEVAVGCYKYYLICEIIRG